MSDLLLITKNYPQEKNVPLIALLCDSQKAALFYIYTRSAYCWKQEEQVEFIITREFNVVIKEPFERFDR